MTDAAAGLTILHTEAAEWEDADPATFSGRARVRRMGGAGADPTLRFYRVAFEPGARTHWHVHAGAQLLVVLEGPCLVQLWEGEVQVAEPGDVIHVAPGVKHWHGAGGDSPMVHLAVNLGAETTWLEPAPPP